ncbi:hypothetical protein COCMIDRAFT_108999 [Bipolaris oryzae ATCC 44560]|uniref:Uncharacterized protein n=1 Tax=Bipolaris oryzae ATCC 44560 TaxID=930090 RepID=W6Z9J8_COCMI|nr:uncharacterized protein COCMIDRAFT_108999 [Bipolaris oryzae ATCC 44560]EUC40371.1 hypothetical protein COCMIDRAFT_108999 [Bipolaris oryzae ATCC 44560]
MTSKLLPVRTALIGLSSSGTTSWAANAHLPVLKTPAGRSKITITGLLNSSVGAAKAAIQEYEFPATTKAYGSPEDLAADPDIDLVICNTRVDKHHEVIMPSIKAGKDVYVEWPIASNKDDIQEIVETARQSGSRVAVGLQRRWNPAIIKLRELLDGGKGELGKILSSNVQAFGGVPYRDMMPPGLLYFTDKEVGGNGIIIGVGHLLDSILSALGPLSSTSIHFKSQIQRPTLGIPDAKTKEVTRHVTSNVPDLLSLHATLAPSAQTAPNATLAFLFRNGPAFPGDPALTWTINCEKGEIKLVSPSSPFLQFSDNDAPVKIQVHEFASGEVRDVACDWTREQMEVPVLARDVMGCLFAFAEGREEGDGWVGVEDAARFAEVVGKFVEV